MDSISSIQLNPLSFTFMPFNPLERFIANPISSAKSKSNGNRTKERQLRQRNRGRLLIIETVLETTEKFRSGAHEEAMKKLYL